MQGYNGYALFFLLSLVDWPIILTAGLGTWFWGRSWAAIIAFCVLAPVVQSVVAAYAHITSAFQPILLLIGFAAALVWASAALCVRKLVARSKL